MKDNLSKPNTGTLSYTVTTNGETKKVKGRYNIKAPEIVRVTKAPKAVIQTTDHGVINPRDYGVSYAQPGVIPLHLARKAKATKDKPGSK